MAKSKWRTVFDRERKESPVGSRFKYDYESVYNEKGVRSLVRKKNMVNIYDMIQAYRPSCDLKYIIARFKQVGDPEILNQREGFYGDMEYMPKSYTEMLQFINMAEENFNSLPTYIKEKFNNNVEEFIAQYGSKEFIEILGLNKEDDIVVEKEEIKENE